jgi:hypothetical protein
LILAFKHYVSQVEEVYKTGIRNRSWFLKNELNAERCDRIAMAGDSVFRHADTEVDFILLLKITFVA